MSDLLSQDEIDALLHGVDDVEEEELGAAGDPGIAQFDFSSQDRIVRGRMPTLELVNERFARHMRISLFNMMRRTAEVSINGVQMLKFGEYVHTLFVPTSLNMVRFRPSRGRRSSPWRRGSSSSWWRTSLAVMAATTPRSRGGNSPHRAAHHPDAAQAGVRGLQRMPGRR